MIGGDTTNYVGIGGCLPDGMFILTFSLPNFSKSDLPNIDYISNLTGYCARRVLRDPRMWLGIFVGGFVSLKLLVSFIALTMGTLIESSLFSLFSIAFGALSLSVSLRTITCRSNLLMRGCNLQSMPSRWDTFLSLTWLCSTHATIAPFSLITDNGSRWTFCEIRSKRCIA